MTIRRITLGSWLAAVSVSSAGVASAAEPAPGNLVFACDGRIYEVTLDLREVES